MKKILIGLAGIVILALVVVIFTNAQKSTQEVKKPATEMKEDCSMCPSSTSAACGTKAEVKTVEAKKCDPAMCGGCGAK
jgi:hypothetical protein